MWYQKYCVVFHFFSLFSRTYWKEENYLKRLEQEILDSMSFPPSSAIHHHPARYLSPHTSNCTFKNNSGMFLSQGDILALVFLYGGMKFYLSLSFSLKTLKSFIDPLADLSLLGIIPWSSSSLTRQQSSLHSLLWYEIQNMSICEGEISVSAPSNCSSTQQY